MARRFAASDCDTWVNGLLYGAAIGSLTGAFLTGVIIAVITGSPLAVFSALTPLMGFCFGVVIGATAGVALVLFGRRKSFAFDPQSVYRPDVISASRSWTLIVLGFGMPAAAIIVFLTNKEPEPRNFPIAGTIYDWPDGTRILPPEGPKYYGKGNVHYRSSDRYPDADAFLITYDGNEQKPFNKVGLPYLKMITSDFAKRDELLFQKTTAGDVVCNRRMIESDLSFPCGLSFKHRGARWQLQFGAHQIPHAERLLRESISRLETFRRRSQHQ